MYREEITRFMLDKMIETEELYDFPSFIWNVRTAHGICRKKVANETKISHTRLYYYETGFFKKPPDDNVLLILANYYGIPLPLLKDKAKRFVEEKKNKWKGMPCHC